MMFNTNQSAKKKLIVGSIATLGLAITVFVLSQVVSTGKFTQNSQAALGSSVDVVIAGAGTSGVSAAIQAAREGATVLLLEETDWVGGQMTTAAVSTMDTAWYVKGGIYGEFNDKVKAYYAAKGKSVDTCYSQETQVCFEPKIGQQILKAMLAEYPKITLKLRTKAVGIVKSENKITGIIVTSSTPSIDGNVQTLVNTKVVIDATEYGDLLPLSGVAYRAANEKSSNLSTNSSAPACIQDITYTAVVRKYAPNTMPSNLKITVAPPGYTPELEAYFATWVKVGGSTKFGKAYLPYSWAFQNSYRGLPDSNNPSDYDGRAFTKITKTVINLANDYPATVKFLENATTRKEVSCAAKLRTIQFMYYMQTTLGETDWAVANDEGYDTTYNSSTENSCPNIPENLKAIERNMPLIAYVRESRRVIGSMTLTAKDIKREYVREGNNVYYTGSNIRFASSIGIGDYASDLHACEAESDLEAGLESLSDITTNPITGSIWVTGPFQIPMETLLAPTLKGLILAEKNISQSRLVNGATRLQPSTMIIGQAAGALAGLAVKKDLSPDKVAVFDVQRVLLNNKAVLYPYLDAAITDRDFVGVQSLSLRGIVSGYSNKTFVQGGSITRATAAVILTRSFSLPIPTTGQIFEDVPATTWGYAYINALSTAGITNGCKQTPPQFCPTSKISNAEVAVFALKSLQKNKPSSISTKNPTTPTYSDVPKTHWAYTQIEGLAASGVVWYCNEAAKTFCPASQITRGRMATIINTIMEKASITTPLTASKTVSEPTQVKAIPNSFEEKSFGLPSLHFSPR